MRARELLGRAGARLLGVILNGVDAPRRSSRYYGYYYSGYYYYQGEGEREQAGTRPEDRARETSTS